MENSKWLAIQAGCLFALGLLGIFCSRAVAENDFGLSWGAYGGANYANLSSANSSASSRTGLGLGVNMEIPVANHVYLQPDVSYLQKGQMGNSGGSTVSILHYDTVEVTALGKLKYGVSDMRLEIFAGPTLGFAVNRQLTQTTGGSVSTLDESSSLRSLDYGIELGLGAEYKMVDGVSIVIEGRYLLGLADINNPTGSGSTTSITTRGIYGTIGLRFWGDQLL